MKKIVGFIIKVAVWTVLLCGVVRLPFFGALVVSMLGVGFVSFFSNLEGESLDDILKSENNKNTIANDVGKSSNNKVDYDDFYSHMWMAGGGHDHGSDWGGGHHHCDNDNCDHHDHN